MPSDVYFTNSDQDSQLLEFKRKRRSQTYNYKGPKEILFFNKSTNPDGSEIKIPVAKAQIPNEVKEAIIFFLPTKKEEKTSYPLLIVNDSTKAFPYGTIRIFNACGAELAGQIGNETLKVPQGISMPFSIKKIAHKGNWVKLGFAIKMPEGYELVYSNEVPFDIETRSIVVLRPPRRSNSLKIYTYLLQERQPPKAEEQQQESANS
ncbi:hypothetical protein [Rubellicoccus peritrichatus]|uniref:Uncharacterized protein n=1 Tax=Rubellicoccus peritrichatus TaxID=3080537 RepID=A0AAQ3QX87_9BACT|nr:hypothetical protein [Puniceicoccus sp. CR14]WOO42630.1 hypothetical protein RZN69_05965 [Puniceicoccus sp. CR14]